MGHTFKGCKLSQHLVQSKDKGSNLWTVRRNCRIILGGRNKKLQSISFANTYANATYYITLNDSKFIHENKNKFLDWGQYWKNKCRDLIWHEN
jgi:hypothetical protein